MPEHDALVLSFSHLREFPREADALQTLRKVASLVKPIMRARGWKVGELAEFYPDQHNLLGLNVNRGQKILIRLRYPGDRSLFLPIEQVTDTLLHELSHIVHGPHDAKFHALWNQLRDEHEGLVRKGYTGEGFLSDGHRLGGGRIPMHEARRLARGAAEKRRALSAGSGQRLGGTAPRPGQDIRRVIAAAVERRNNTLQGCGTTTHNDQEIRKISETATRNGFKTKAEEDVANEAAIAQALWELVQEDERAKYGKSYLPPSAQHPEGNGGGVYLSGETGSIPSPDRQDSMSGQNHEPLSRSKVPTFGSASRGGSSTHGWTCAVCTLHNPGNFLSCDACGTEKPRVFNNTSLRSSSTAQPTVGTSIRGTAGGSREQFSNVVSGRMAAGPSAPGPEARAFWSCSFCGKSMERQWWTCSDCGKMKESS